MLILNKLFPAIVKAKWWDLINKWRSGAENPISLGRG
jgi:hypothetical protein|tara:strand:+ start:921 stop:1031 length:111 start_codon:yes stop_codon:yes gene_type:complete